MTDNPLVLRQFVSSPELGWKVAWSDRMISLYTGAFPASFYSGDAFGSFSAWMRLLTGQLFALGGAWFLLPRLDNDFNVKSEVGRAGTGKTAE
jgi:hypothetical protein